jgi:hypothetical protein
MAILPISALRFAPSTGTQMNGALEHRDAALARLQTLS